MPSLIRYAAALSAAAGALSALPALAQQDEAFEGLASDERIMRVTLGASLKPKFPGSDSHAFGPLVDVDTKTEGGQFYFEAPDESFDFFLIDSQGFALGPVVDYRGARSAEDVGAALPKVKFSLEPGVFAQYQAGENFRVRGELRKGVSGHKGWIADFGADFIMRDGDSWLFSVGPRVSWADDQYHDAWYGVAPGDAAAAGLPAYDPGSGIQSYGATSTLEAQVGGPWGIYAYAKYDRLTGDAANSPIVVQLGSRDQFSGGIGLSYTFRR